MVVISPLLESKFVHKAETEINGENSLNKTQEN